jgi:hypothetical protein
MFNSAVVPSPDSGQPEPQAGRYTVVPRTSPPSARKTCGPDWPVWPGLVLPAPAGAAGADGGADD